MSKVLAVGDVHAKLWILEAVEKIINQYDKIVFIGDYCDDWGADPMKSINTWYKVKEMHEKYPDKVIPVTGNHDYSYVNKVGDLSSGYNKLTQALINLPDNKDLKNWVSKLPISVVENGVIYSHAGFVEEWFKHLGDYPIWGNLSPLWARPNDGHRYMAVPQVFGHTPSETCWEVEPNIWCIDTFSTQQDGKNIGDRTVLEVIDGKSFNIKRLDGHK